MAEINVLHPFRVSIHAPAQGATVDGKQYMAVDQEFQSTPPRRGRPSPVITYHLSAEVSIHAPAQGATCLKMKEKF